MEDFVADQVAMQEAVLDRVAQGSTDDLVTAFEETEEERAQRLLRREKTTRFLKHKIAKTRIKRSIIGGIEYVDSDSEAEAADDSGRASSPAGTSAASLQSADDASMPSVDSDYLDAMSEMQDDGAFASTCPPDDDYMDAVSDTFADDPDSDETFHVRPGLAQRIRQAIKDRVAAAAERMGTASRAFAAKLNGVHLLPKGLMKSRKVLLAQKRTEIEKVKDIERRLQQMKNTSTMSALTLRVVCFV